jgi:hypothetical protein
MPSTVNSRPLRPSTTARMVPVVLSPLPGGVPLLPMVVGVMVGMGVTDGLEAGEGEGEGLGEGDGEGLGEGEGRGDGVGVGEGEGLGVGEDRGVAVCVAMGLAAGRKALADTCGLN